MIDIFLSYRRETGVECCSLLQKILENGGYNVFFDSHSMRQGDFEQQIDKAIKECSTLLAVLAPGDLDRCFKEPEKDWIVHELQVAIEHGKTVIPVVFKHRFTFPEKCESIPSLQYLSKQQICDISGPDFANLVTSRLYEFLKNPPAKKLREDYHNGIRQEKYLEWEIETLKTIYAGCDFVNEFGRFFPVTVFEGSQKAQYPFDSLNERGNLLPIGSEIDYKNSACYSEFQKIVGPNIHFPDLYGYTNAGLLFDEEGKVAGFKAVPRTYKETVFSSHIMHYELWKAYRSINGTRLGTIDDMPIRKAIHAEKDINEVIISGCGRSSLCDVCLVVMAYDKEEADYDLAVATRSANVACYPGYLSIVPSGGFELYELESKQTAFVIKKNFSIVAAVYREYIEELFGDEEFDKPTGNDDLRRLYRNSHIKELRENINDTYFFEFLGVAFDLISLRPTFTFVLKIDDPDFLYNNQIKKNEENTDIRFISLEDFEEEVTENFDDHPLMCESAGVYTLLKKNHLYHDAINRRKSKASE